MRLHSVCASSIVLSPPHQKETRNRVSAKRSLWPRCKDSWSRSFSFPTLGLRFRIQGPPAQALPAPGCLSHTELPLSDDGRPSGPRAGSESAPRGPPRLVTPLSLPTRRLVPITPRPRPPCTRAPAARRRRLAWPGDSESDSPIVCPLGSYSWPSAMVKRWQQPTCSHCRITIVSSHESSLLVVWPPGQCRPIQVVTKQLFTSGHCQ